MAEVKDPRTFFKVVMLVLASHNNEIYQGARNVWKKYKNVSTDVKVYMVYGVTDVSTMHDLDESDLIYQDIPETYNPGMLLKTIRGMEHIQAHHTYLHFVRTNISTFWDFERLLEHTSTLPLKLCYSGDGPFHNRYVSGTDTIVTPEMIDAIIRDKLSLEYFVPEDDAMGRFFHGVMGAKFLPNRICFMEDVKLVDLQIVKERIIHGRRFNDHYRVKNRNTVMRKEIDAMVYSILLNEIYNIP